jgi:hypothetical protein
MTSLQEGEKVTGVKAERGLGCRETKIDNYRYYILSFSSSPLHSHNIANENVAESVRGEREGERKNYL